jgi:peptidoglycan/LPS O-acetylase OafA/YrhL
LRAIAVLAVFYCHYGQMAVPALRPWISWTGVDLFFVLSGYLITGILYDSRESPRYFRDFYVRRALRIFPLYFGFFAAMILLTAVLRLSWGRLVWTNLVYLMNWMPGVIGNQAGSPSVISVAVLGRTHDVTFSHFWSLCVEEQFYLVWPLTVWLLGSRRALLRVFAGGVVATLLLRTWLYFHCLRAQVETDFLYYSTYARCDALMVGAWLAVWLRGAKLTRARLRGVAWSAMGAGAGLLAVLLAVWKGAAHPLAPEDPVMQTVGFTLVDVAAGGLLLLALDERSRVQRVLRHRWLGRLGRISYGFYFFHYLPYLMMANLAGNYLLPHHVRWMIAPIAFGFAWGAAELSFRYWESPFLRLKDRAAPSHKSIPTGEEDLPRLRAA